MVVIPPPQVRATIASKLADFVAAIETHPKWNLEQPDRGVFYVWDFVNRTKYMLSEVDTLREGREPQHADQIKSAARGQTAAEELFADVVTRSITIDQMVNGPAFMLSMMGLDVDITPEMKSKSRAVKDVLTDGL